MHEASWGSTGVDNQLVAAADLAGSQSFLKSSLRCSHGSGHFAMPAQGKRSATTGRGFSARAVMRQGGYDGVSATLQLNSPRVVAPTRGEMFYTDDSRPRSFANSPSKPNETLSSADRVRTYPAAVGGGRAVKVTPLPPRHERRAGMPDRESEKESRGAHPVLRG